MIQRLIQTCLAAILLTSTGCGMFSKKPAGPKDTGAIASETEESLRKRWVDRRTTELVAQGVAAEAAKTQASQEFREKFEYTGAAKK